MAVHILLVSVMKVYGADPEWWMLTEPARIPCPQGDVIVPAGYITDYASRPGFVPDWLIPKSGLSALPSAAHDYLCEKGIVSRREADLTFNRLLLEAGVPRWQRLLMYYYVRLLGWARYKKQSKLSTPA